MAEIHSSIEDLPPIPDDLTLAQFILDYHHPCRPVRKHGIPWIIDEQSGKKVGLDELRASTYGLANALKMKFDIKEDDVVLIYSPNHIDYLVAIWATHRLGAIMSGANPSYTTEELLYHMNLVKPSFLIAHPDCVNVALSAASVVGIDANRVIVFDAPGVQNSHVTIQALITLGLASPPSFVERHLSPGEGKRKVAFLNLSSGTTGKPKAIAIPHYAPISTAVQAASFLNLNADNLPPEKRRYRPGDISSVVLPIFHVYGLAFNTHFILFCGMSIVLSPKFNLTNFLRSIERFRITHLFLVPPQVVLLCKHPDVQKYNLTSVRLIKTGAAPLSGETMKELVSLFPSAHIEQAYGTTEASTITLCPLEKYCDFSGSSGVLLPGISARVERPDGSLAEFGELGELVLKSPAMALGYINNPEATAETFVNGWYRTGDEVKLLKTGELFIVDRLKEILKVRGFQVSPAELESCLLEHPDIADACIVGVLDDYSGELPKAFVVLLQDAAARARKDPGAAEEIAQSLIQHVASKKVAHKRLAGGVEFVDSIPKTPTGKLLRRVLRDRARSGGAQSKPRGKL
ncbi:hypothetical protein ID866_8088 [Astraeus odoratus]|nr:hypothetical protein ID866_8088 [Astraeus odoratus]